MFYCRIVLTCHNISVVGVGIQEIHEQSSLENIFMPFGGIKNNKRPWLDPWCKHVYSFKKMAIRNTILSSFHITTKKIIIANKQITSQIILVPMDKFEKYHLWMI
jgi:hypothetical protein